MGQTRLHSFIESIVNVMIGFGVAILSQVLIFPLYGIHIPLSSNFKIGAWFTAISIVRSYIVRRWFNALMMKAINKLPL
jgi:NhaP-type Na+/H+ or K+/H+ antiporter